MDTMIQSNRTRKLSIWRARVEILDLSQACPEVSILRNVHACHPHTVDLAFKSQLWLMKEPLWSCVLHHCPTPQIKSHSPSPPLWPRTPSLHAGMPRRAAQRSQVSINQACGWYRHGLSTLLLLLPLLCLVHGLLIPRLPSSFPPHFLKHSFHPPHHRACELPSRLGLRKNRHQLLLV